MTKAKVKLKKNKEERYVGIMIDLDKKEVLIKSTNPTIEHQFLHIDKLLIYTKKDNVFDTREFKL